MKISFGGIFQPGRLCRDDGRTQPTHPAERGGVHNPRWRTGLVADPRLRDPGCSHRAGRLAEGWVARRGDRLHYRFEGADLLGLAEPSPYETHDDAARARHEELQGGGRVSGPLDTELTVQE